MWAFNLENRIITLAGNKLRIEEQLTEILDYEPGERSLFLKVRSLAANGSLSMIKMRYQLNPRGFEIDTEAAHKEVLHIAEQELLHECDAIQLLGEAGLGPQYIDHIMCSQPKWMPFPGGYGHFLVMEVPPGENLDGIWDELSDCQLEGIRTQLAPMLNIANLLRFWYRLLRQSGHKLVDQHPSYLNYDVETDKPYLVDLPHLRGTDPTAETSLPIDEESPYVEAFNLWRAPYRESEEGEDDAGEPPLAPCKLESHCLV
ncbi:hypothetical protein BO99DRAFT_454773 [Aspergillus violaceofuscus CBS 115571]|uniref:Protein kinase domain-containing protein n=1 Tax=Aspergillus violaceofuscus (strain CBS 115571) TaxID=1450538 RepID=A0A2V5GUU9_ASPV1|nr:hypothetical protein BO99DRAFT_454773 [Aspergillus violaceofuscus CBS 115571]